MRFSRLALVLLSLSTASQASSVASEPERAPLANSVGRFWGFGYGAGYHARYESRFGWNRHVPALKHSAPAFSRAHLPHFALPRPQMFSALDDSGTSQALQAHGWNMEQARGYPNQSILHDVPKPTEQTPQTILEPRADAPGSAGASMEPSANGWMRRMLKPYADTPAPNRPDAPSPSDRNVPENNSVPADALDSIEHEAKQRSADDDLLAPSTGDNSDSPERLDR